MSDTLILDRNWTPQSFCSWQNAVKLIWEGRATVVKEDEGGRELHAVSMTMGMPRVIVVRNAWQRRKRQSVPFSRRNILIRDEHSCQYCGHELTLSEFTLDHVVPRSKGGISSWLNLVAACIRCNKKKAGETLKESGMKLLRAPVEPKANDPRFNFKLHVHVLRPEWRDYASWLYYNVTLEN